ncbi:hypothetical protein SAMN05445060_2789 [Williamsia sterculiae]|uniref:Uncharacterized protein n=1 Tax=Williamsia sterculiae TaxID=1344003 RepID=A0A1N7GHA6_9NOCA|nr:hypothetical protein SAMN05445060_2789 [Williamsia sterculiae]
MSQIKYVKLEQRRDIGLSRTSYSQDEAITEAMRRTRADIAQEYGLKVYSLSNYIASLVEHDPRARQHLKEVRKETRGNGRRPNYHRTRPLDEDD